MANKRFSLLLVLALYGCAQEARVKVDSDPTADFSRYKTYTWAYGAAPPGINPLNYQRIKTAIDRELASRGYTQSQSGDFAVGFTIGGREKVEVTNFGTYGGFFPGYGAGFGRGWASNVDVRNITEGILAIDFYDLQTKRPVWHGQATKVISSEGADPEDIDQAVSSLLARFPPGAPTAK